MFRSSPAWADKGIWLPLISNWGAGGGLCQTPGSVCGLTSAPCSQLLHFSLHSSHFSCCSPRDGVKLSQRAPRLSTESDYPNLPLQTLRSCDEQRIFMVEKHGLNFIFGNSVKEGLIFPQTAAAESPCCYSLGCVETINQRGFG